MDPSWTAAFRLTPVCRPTEASLSTAVAPTAQLSTAQLSSQFRNQNRAAAATCQVRARAHRSASRLHCLSSSAAPSRVAELEASEGCRQLVLAFGQAGMLFRQFFERESSTYTYLVASRQGGEALLIDPVKEEVARYLQLIHELKLKLVFAIDTHVHADHVTGLGDLRNETQCVTMIGSGSKAECVSRKVDDGEALRIDGLELRAMYTPGHTDDSCSFVMSDRVFTGDTLLIRGTGRTDFQNGDARAQYKSLFSRLLKLPDETLVYPAHDYKGWTVSTIGEERAHNPRLKVSNEDEYVAMMNSLNLPNPKLMDIAVAANLACGVR